MSAGTRFAAGPASLFFISLTTYLSLAPYPEQADLIAHFFVSPPAPAPLTCRHSTGTLFLSSVVPVNRIDDHDGMGTKTTTAFPVRICVPHQTNLDIFFFQISSSPRYDRVLIHGV